MLQLPIQWPFGSYPPYILPQTQDGIDDIAVQARLRSDARLNIALNPGRLHPHFSHCFGLSEHPKLGLPCIIMSPPESRFLIVAGPLGTYGDFILNFEVT